MKRAYILTLPDDDTKYVTGSFSGGDPGYSRDAEISGQTIRGATLKTYFRLHQYAPDDFIRSAPTVLLVNNSGMAHMDFGIGLYEDFSLVSKEFFELIEFIEPNVHQFIGINHVKTANGAELNRKYYHFNITRCFNAINESLSNITLNKRVITIGGSIKYIKSMRINSPRKITLRESVVGSCHIWRGTLEDVNRVFVSSDLKEKMEGKQLKYVSFEEVSVA